MANFSDLFLFHQLRIRTIVHYALAKDRSRKRAVDFLRVDILQLSVENELVAFLPKTHCRLFPQENKGKNFTILHILVCDCKKNGATVHIPSAGN